MNKYVFFPAEFLTADLYRKFSYLYGGTSVEITGLPGSLSYFSDTDNEPSELRYSGLVCIYNIQNVGPEEFLQDIIFAVMDLSENHADITFYGLDSINTVTDISVKSLNDNSEYDFKTSEVKNPLFTVQSEKFGLTINSTAFQILYKNQNSNKNN